MSAWQKDKAWSDVCLQQIKQICGMHLIGEPPAEEDRERNTDLIVLRMDPVRIACRIRNHDEYYKKYGHQFTIRTARPSGNKTELAKIIEGWGDYLFYGFRDSSGQLTAWTLANLNSFRIWHMTRVVKDGGKLPGHENKNKDGSSNFRAYSWQELPSGFQVASQRPIDEPAAISYADLFE